MIKKGTLSSDGILMILQDRPLMEMGLTSHLAVVLRDRVFPWSILEHLGLTDCQLKGWGHKYLHGQKQVLLKKKK